MLYLPYRMEELQRHRSSRKGYRSHLTRLITNANELLSTSTEPPPEEKTKITATLDLLLGQLIRKENLLADLDTKIIQLVGDEDELETEVFEAEEIQGKIAETVSNIKFFTARLRQSVPQSVSPQHPKSKIPDPTTVTQPEQPPTAASLETIPNADRNEVSLQTPDDSIPHLLPHDSVPTNRGQVAAHLPKLSIPIFTGDPLDWQPFWDSFEAAIHSNTQLNGAQIKA